MTDDQASDSTSSIGYPLETMLERTVSMDQLHIEHTASLKN